MVCWLGRAKCREQVGSKAAPEVLTSRERTDYLQRSGKLTVRVRPARITAVRKPHQPFSLYDPGAMENRYLASARTVSEATRVELE